MEKTIQSVTESFIAANKDKVKPARLKSFGAVVNALAANNETFSINNFMAMTETDESMLELFYGWLKAQKSAKHIRRGNSGYNFHYYRWTK